MSVLDVETLGFGVSKETFDPPSFPVKTQSTFGCRDICSHYNQFVFFPSNRNRFFSVRAMPHNQRFPVYLICYI